MGEYDDAVKGMMEYISNIEKNNVVLMERLCEVERTMGMQTTALETEITDLNAQVVILCTTYTSPAYKLKQVANNEKEYKR